MLTLTLKHPWPWAIAHLGKDVENRVWLPPESAVGQKILVHGGKSPYGADGKVLHPSILQEIRLDFQQGIMPTLQKVLETQPPESTAALRQYLRQFLTPGSKNEIRVPPSTMVMSGIIGHVTLQAVARDWDSPWAMPGQYHWVISDFTPFETPIQCRGAQRLWEPPREVMYLVDRQMQAIP